MRLTKKTLSTLLGLLFLGFIAGSLLWEVVERLGTAMGAPLDLSIGPIGFDVHALALSVRANPGSLLGALGGAFLYRSL